MKSILILTFLPAITFACTSGYNTYFDGQCLWQNNQNYIYADAASLMIKSERDNTDCVRAISYDMWLGLTCNGTNFIWDDGTVANYTNFKENGVCDQANKNVRYYLSNTDGGWHPTTMGAQALCEAETRSCTSVRCVYIQGICDTYELQLLEQGKSDEENFCYMFDTKLTTRDQAEANCETQEAFISPIHDQTTNDFIKRTALGYGITAGVHIGLKFAGNDTYVWADGSDVDFKPFAPGFPNEMMGECVAMGINTFPGKWMNVDCATPLPYMCTKRPHVFDETAVPAGCNDDDDSEFFPGDEIFSPTWGAATGPASCSYVAMDLDTTKKISVEFMLFESNACCDSLTIYDGLFGDKVLKTLSGYYGITSIKVTGTSNAIRLVWNATSGAHVRGWHAKVTSA